MKLGILLAFVGLLLALAVSGNFTFMIIWDCYLGRIIYVNKKHMNITVEGCATPSLTLGFYTPMKASHPL